MKWGSGITNARLLTTFYFKLDTFLAAYKREYADQNKEDNVEEREADATSSTLMTMLMKWAAHAGSVFVWAFSLLMWHLMARSINIDSIALNSIKKGISDSITFKYMKQRWQKGEFACEKMIIPILMTNLSVHLQPLGVTSVLIQRYLSSLRSHDTKYKTASQNCSHQVAATGEHYADQIKSFLRVSRFNIHGVRKDRGTHAASTMTCPPLFTSIACHGKWLMGKIMDVYF